MNDKENIKNFTFTMLDKIRELENGLKKIENFEKWLVKEYLLQENRYNEAEKDKNEIAKNYYSAKAQEAYNIYSVFKDFTEVKKND